MTLEIPFKVTRSTWLVPERKELLELLDAGQGCQAEVNANLVEMARSNRYLGDCALTLHLYPRLLADLGPGSAEVPQTVARWAQRCHRTRRSIRRGTKNGSVVALTLFYITLCSQGGSAPQ